MSALRRAAGVVLALLVALAVLVPWSPSGAQEAEPEPTAGEEAAVDPFDRLAGCIGGGGRLLVVLLVDESGSLNTTDPDDQRVAAARAAVASLDRLREDGGASVDVLLSVFSYDFQVVGEWTTLSPETTPALDRQVQGLADRSNGMDTDFHNALDGARLALADRASEVTETAGEVCKAVLLFTDGNFALGARTTPEQVERFGTTKPYAPGLELTSEDAVAEATEKGVEALCRAGGVADQVRSDRITLLTVPLNVVLVREGQERETLGTGARRLLQALTTGRAEGRTCGDPQTADPGAYLEAAETSELLRTFDLVASRIGGGTLVGEVARPVPCEDDPCPEASVTIDVDRSLRAVHVFAALPGNEGRVVVQPPEGDALEVAVGEDAEEQRAGATVTARWLGPRSATIDVVVPPDGSASGEWVVSLVGRDGEGRGVLQVLTFTDVVAALTSDTELRLGEAAELRAELGSRSGEAEVPELAEATVSASLTDPITGKPLVLEEGGGEATGVVLDGDDGAFVAEVTVPRATTAAAVLVTLRLRGVTADGAVVSSVAPEVAVAVRRPDGYPQLAPPRLDLTSVEGEGAAGGDLVLVQGRGDAGCAWIEGLTVRGAPAEARPFTIGVEGIGRSAESCTPIDGPLTVPVEIRAAERASGTVTGHVRVMVARGDGDAPIPTDVPIGFEMARGVDQAKRLLLAAGLLAAGLLLPLVLLVLINLLTTRFQRLDAVRGARIPVVVTGAGRVLRTDGGSRPLTLLPGDFEELEGQEGRRRFTWGGLVFRARTPLNPFGEPYASISPEEGTADVARSARRTDLALGLAGEWLFLLDQDATRAAGASAGAIHGHVVAFAAPGAVGPQAGRLVGAMELRLPRTAEQLARVAGLR